METQNLLTFKAASVPALPRLVCVGSVGMVKEGKVSGSEKYIVQPIDIVPEGSGRAITYNFLYRPEWLRPGFDPDQLTEGLTEEDNPEEYREAKSLQSVYRRNINVHNGISALRGMAGSEDNFNYLANKLLSLPEITIPAVQEVLHSFFMDTNEGQLFGYVLKQQQTKTDEINEDGKNVWVRENRYEVDRFFDYTQEALRTYKRNAEKSKGGTIITFDVDLGF